MNTLAAVVVALAVTEIFLLTRGAHEAARLAELPEAERRAVTVRVPLVLAGWLAGVLALAAAGVLARFDAKPPPMMLVLAGSMGLFAFGTSRPVVGAMLRAAPLTFPVLVQAIRVPIELFLHGLYREGRFPVHLTFEGRNLDILVGLTAPVVAYLVHTGRLGARGLAAWNVMGLGLLANIVGMALTTMPGPLHLDWPGVSNTVVAEAPFVLLPALLVPVALFAHVLSLRQCVGAWRAGAKRAVMP